MRISNLLLLSLIVFLSLSLLAAGKKSGDEKELLDNLDLFTDVVTMIDEDYYRSVEPRDLMVGAMRGMIASLDRYSYIKRKGEVRNAGIGLELAIVDNILTVVSAVEGGPAAREGVIHGDKIVKIDGDRIGDITLDDVRRMIRGEPGTEVTLTLYREGTKEMKDVVLERQEVVSPGLVESVIYDGAVGYMRLASLPPGSSLEFIGEVKGLLEKGVEGLVIDLRDNPGGDIDEAAAIAGYLVGDEKKIVSIESRLENERKEIIAPAAPPPHISLAVLVNGGTAREAEVIAGALKGYGRAVVIGSKTFGDGSIQRDIPLDETRSIHLMVGRYIVSGETSFDGEGIEPDIEVEIEPEKEALLQKIRESVDVDEKERPDDSQFHRAVDLLKGMGILKGEMNK